MLTFFDIFKGRMKSNATLLTFLTISEEAGEKIFFIYIKELEEIAPAEPHWYNDRGGNGKADFLWEEKKLKQWCVIANDSIIDEYFCELIETQKLEVKWKSKSIAFIAPKFEKRKLEENIYEIPGLESCGRNERPTEFICESWPVDLSFLIGEENNCEFLSGYKHNATIKPVMPAGLFSERFLSDNLKKRICVVHSDRGIYWALHAIRKDIKDDPWEYYGFIQRDNSFKKETYVIIRDIDGQSTLGRSDINLETGKWYIKLSEPISRGQFIMVNKLNDHFLCGEKFYLIKNFSLNTQIVSTVITDLYKRKINIVPTEEKQSLLTEAIIWNASSAPTDEQGQIELSDHIAKILQSLGKRIIISDPYFLGEINIEDDQLKLNTSQAIFLNALIIALAKGSIEEINLLGNWRKIKSGDGNKTTLVDKYKVIYKFIKKTFDGSTLLKLKAFNICFTEQPFHDRYWLDGENQNIVYHISNSVSGIFKSSELKIDPLSELEVFKVQPKIQKRLDDSEKQNLIS